MDEINEKEIEDLFANFGVTCGTSWVPEYQSLLQLTIFLYIRISVTVLRNILGLTIGPISVTVLSNTKMSELDLYILLERWCKATPNPYT